MKNQPFFSVIIPTYNRAGFLPQGIQSVLSQSFSDWELIIVDDGSTDNTREIIQSFKDSRIKYLFQKNAERSSARNNGIKNASGQWICFLDSDDEYLPNHLTVLHDYINLNLFYGLLLTKSTVRINGVEFEHPKIETNNNVLQEIWSKFILINSVCVHSAILKENDFNPRFRLWEDTHLWLRIAAQYPVYQIEDVTCIQNIHGSNSVSLGFKKVKVTDLEQYVLAINDLQKNFQHLLKEKISLTEFKNYKEKKYFMYLYQARQNRQFGVSLAIWIKAFSFKPSLYLMKELPKIFLNKFGVGIHENSQA